MPEYHSLRFVLAILEFFLAFQIGRRRIGSLLIFGVFLWFDATSNLMPMRSQSPEWWRYCWLPLAYVRLGLTIAASLEIFSFLVPSTYSRERHLIAGFAASIGVFLSVAGMYWSAENWFQGMTTFRQYVLLALATATAAAWAWVRVMRPAGSPTCLERSHGLLWCLWLVVLFLMSSTGAGGLARLIGNWRHFQTWRWMNDVLLVCQIVLVGLWVHRLTRQQLPGGQAGE